ncbi:MAG: c-type cytochrome biogenesis protein CcmI [Bauldia sp.]|uniref:c-type cytochrome biogenesis protein CcmI n=1 Tax=Bauldia sp. TaxID=2575872 RepID=UPI001D449050|nr:c-type cytochrome biogenesis protein CcmI [Bauldia sp.]MCB1494172.1 c-type cytochrome biogenesis protein CcmI [Bauldia sp.]
MIFWVIMAVLAASVSLSVLMPLYRTRQLGRRLEEQEMSVYRDQLGEIDRDVERGLIAPSEAEAARNEIARRLIKADGSKPGSEQGAAATPRAERPRQVAGILVVVVMPLAAIGLYLWVGSPNLPDAPLEARLSAPPAEQDTAALLARVEKHLADNPDDAQGWRVLAPVYARMGRYDEAATAYRNIVRLLGGTAENETALGEALVRADGGTVTDEAKAAFERARALDPQMIGPRFYLALAKGQAGETEDAIAGLQKLVEDSPADAPWLGSVRQVIAHLESIGEAPRGPSAADIEAAGGMDGEDRAAMIEGMVAQLADRLEAEPDDASGWARLVRSYMVLGRPDDARAALDKARAALAGDEEKLARVESEAAASGLSE